jgi:hypothetical protein
MLTFGPDLLAHLVDIACRRAPIKALNAYVETSEHSFRLSHQRQTLLP